MMRLSYFVGLGIISVKKEIVFTLITESPLVFTLTCTTTGGPATTVEWTRNGRRMYYSRSSVVVDTQHSTYENKITVRGRFLGVYSVNVSNSRTPSAVVSQYNVTGKELCILKIVSIVDGTCICTGIASYN